jgi:small subunit ribosomal protein S8e
MPIIHKGKLGRKPTGGKYMKTRPKRLFEKGSDPANTTLGKPLVKKVRVKGGKEKTKTYRLEKVNVLDPKTKKFSSAVVKVVLENPANRNFARRNIITKGCVIETDKGKARVTSRPGQNGGMTAVLI